MIMLDKFKRFFFKERLITSCTYCGVGCKLELHQNQLKGNKEYLINEGKSCLKGITLFEVQSKNRLKNVLFRENLNDEFQKNNLKYVIKYIADKIKDTSSERIGFYSAGQVLIEDYYVANKLFKGNICTANIDSNSRTCIASSVVGLKKVFGVDYIPAQMKDVLETDLILVIGANPAYGHIVFFEKYIRPAVKNGAKIVVIDPFYSKTAEFALKSNGLYLQINVGSDINLLNAVAKRLLDDKFLDISYIEEELNGGSQYLEQVRKIIIDEELKKCEISKEAFDELIKLIKKHPKMVSIWSMGINQSSEGVEKNLAVLNLHLILKRFGEFGNNPFPLTGQTNARGGRDVGALATMLAIHRDFDEESRKILADFWKVPVENLPDKKGHTIPEMIEAAENGNIDVMIIMHTDPIYSLPDRNRVEKALKNIPLVIEINAYENTHTSNFAHIRIPAKAWGEKYGRQTNMDRHISYHQKIIDDKYIPKEAVEDWKILCLLAKKLGFNGFKYKNSDEIYKEFQSLTKLSLKAHLNHYDADIKKLKNNKEFYWGKDFFKKHKALTHNQKPNIFFPKNQYLAETKNEKFPFYMVSIRSKNHWNSTTKTSLSSKIKDDLDVVFINEKDAKKYNLLENDKVKILSKHGYVENLKIKYANIKEGIIALYANFPKVNYLTPFIYDKESFQPDYNHTPVRIEKM